MKVLDTTSKVQSEDLGEDVNDNCHLLAKVRKKKMCCMLSARHVVKFRYSGEHFLLKKNSCEQVIL